MSRGVMCKKVNEMNQHKEGIGYSQTPNISQDLLRIGDQRALHELAAGISVAFHCSSR